MLTKREIIAQAFEEIGLGAYAYNAQPEDLQTALTRLNALLAFWAGEGAVTEADSTGRDLDTASNVPVDAEEGVICALAVRIAPSYGKTPSPDTKARGRQGHNLMMRKNIALPTRKADFASVPAGAGYKQRGPFLYHPEES